MKTETSPGNYHLPTHFSPWTQCIPVIWKEQHLEIRNYSSTLRIKSPETQKKCLIVKLCDDQSCEQQKLFTFQTGLWHSKVWGMAGIINHFGTITFTSLLILKMEKSGCFPIKPDTFPQHHCLAKPRLYQPVDTVVWCLQAPGNLFFLISHYTLSTDGPGPGQRPAGGLDGSKTFKITDSYWTIDPVQLQLCSLFTHRCGEQ